MNNYAMNQYNENCRLQNASILKFYPKILGALRLSGEVTRVADYGCSEGQNSLLLFRNLISDHREHSKTPVEVSHVDLPSNDWNAFTKVMQKESYLSFPDTSLSIVPGSFYEKLFLEGSIDFGFASFAFHYLDTPIPAEDSVYVDLSSDPQVQESLASLASQSISKILSSRIAELRSEGVLCIIHPEFDSSKLDTIRVLQKARESLKQDLSVEILKNYTIQGTVVNEQLWKAEIAKFPELELVEMERVSFVPPFYEDYLKEGDLEKYARTYAGWLEAWALPPLRRCISHLGETEISEILEKFDFYLRSAITEDLQPNYFSSSIIILKKR